MDAAQPSGDNVVPLRPHGEIPGSPVAFDETANRDRLTGLPGLASFEEALRGASNRRRGGEHPWVAVAGLDGMSAVVAPAPTRDTEPPARPDRAMRPS